MNEEEEGGGMNEEDAGTAQRRHRLDRATSASIRPRNAGIVRHDDDQEEGGARVGARNGGARGRVLKFRDASR